MFAYHLAGLRVSFSTRTHRHLQSALGGFFPGTPGGASPEPDEPAGGRDVIGVLFWAASSSAGRVMGGSGPEDPRTGE